MRTFKVLVGMKEAQNGKAERCSNSSTGFIVEKWSCRGGSLPESWNPPRLKDWEDEGG
jgi:hypothetical protein